MNCNLTREVAADRCLNHGLHPLSHNELLVVAEEMCFIVVMHDFEAIPAGINILIRDDFVTKNIDVALDLRLLLTKEFREFDMAIFLCLLTVLSLLFSMYR